jgi:hypothetical protein
MLAVVSVVPAAGVIAKYSFPRKPFPDASPEIVMYVAPYICCGNNAIMRRSTNTDFICRFLQFEVIAVLVVLIGISMKSNSCLFPTF